MSILQKTVCSLHFKKKYAKRITETQWKDCHHINHDDDADADDHNLWSTDMTTLQKNSVLIAL